MCEITCCLYRGGGASVGLYSERQSGWTQQSWRAWVEAISVVQQVQERMTHQIADILRRSSGQRSRRRLEAKPQRCMTIGGFRQTGESGDHQTPSRGLIKSNLSTRAEVNMSLINTAEITPPRHVDGHRFFAIA